MASVLLRYPRQEILATVVVEGDRVDLDARPRVITPDDIAGSVGEQAIRQKPNGIWFQ